MNILMLNNEFPPIGGGTGIVNFELLRAFQHFPDVSVDLVTSSAGEKDTHEQFLGSAKISIYATAVGRRDIHHASNAELIRYGWGAFRVSCSLLSRQSYDCCLAWSTVPAGAVALWLNHRFGLPYCVRVGGPDIPGFEKRYRFLYPFLAPAIRQTWRRAQSVVVKCAHEASLVKRAGGPNECITIENGVDTERFAPVRRPPNSSLRVLCVARLIERKGHRVLFKAIQRLAERGISLQLDLVGRGDSEKELRVLAQELGLAKMIQFHGEVDRATIPVLYADADLFVLPSFNEGMSVAALEAIASGLPVVTTAETGMDDIVREGENGFLVPVGDAPLLAQALERLLTSPSLRESMGRASRLRAEQLTWTKVAKRYHSLLQSLANAERHHVRR